MDTLLSACSRQPRTRTGVEAWIPPPSCRPPPSRVPEAIIIVSARISSVAVVAISRRAGAESSPARASGSPAALVAESCGDDSTISDTSGATSSSLRGKIAFNYNLPLGVKLGSYALTAEQI